MALLCRRWNTPRCFFGDVAVLAFVLTQCMDGVLTYLGVTIWGLQAEANPLVSSAMLAAGLGPGLAGVKLVAVALGVALHRCRVHNVVALLTVFYVGAAIVPWTVMFLMID